MSGSLNFSAALGRGGHVNSTALGRRMRGTHSPRASRVALPSSTWMVSAMTVRLLTCARRVKRLDHAHPTLHGRFEAEA